MIFQKYVLIFLLLPACFLGRAQEYIPLWPKGKMPDSKGLSLGDSIANERIYRIINPGMYAFFPSKDDNSGAAVLIFPGGGYEHLTYNLGGFQLAKWFNALGISAFVVNYRLPNSPDLQQRETGPLLDAQQALRIVRDSAVKWGIHPDKIGVQGSSAGGHLAALLATETKTLRATDAKTLPATDTTTLRVNFMILVSPVITMGEYAHKGSRNSLLGPTPSPELAKRYSVENNVTALTPPAFIADAFNDKTVSPQNSLLFYQALLSKNISTSFHVFPQGGHAIGTNRNPGSTQLWMNLCESWLKEMGFIK